MSKMVFCNIAHMKYYRGITDDDKPVNGGKFVQRNGTAYECYNFFPVNHFCYGYFQHVGDRIDLSRIEEVADSVNVLHDVTVIWVANRKIVGWYENADMFRYRQSFCEPEFDEDHDWWDHWFKAREENVYLIPDEERNFEVPSAPQKGKGMGMGQSNLWYADSDWAIEVFLPEVEKYLASLKGKYPIEYLKAEDLYKKISPTNEDDGDLFDKACEMLDSTDNLRALEIFNYLIYRAETPYKVCLDKYYKGLALERLLLYDEALNTYKQVAYEFNNLDEDEKLTRIDLDCYWQIARINSVLGKNSVAYEMWEKLFNEETDIQARCDALIRMMDMCQSEENWNQLKALLNAYDELDTDEFEDEVEKFKKVLKRHRRL